MSAPPPPSFQSVVGGKLKLKKPRAAAAAAEPTRGCVPVRVPAAAAGVPVLGRHAVTWARVPRFLRRSFIFLFSCRASAQMGAERLSGVKRKAPEDAAGAAAAAA